MPEQLALRVGSDFGCVLAKPEALSEAVERIERSAIIAGRKPARSAADSTHFYVES